MKAKLIFAVRCIIGSSFIVSGITKVFAMTSFIETVYRFNVLPVAPDGFDQHYCCDSGPAGSGYSSPPYYADSHRFGNNDLICDSPELSSYDISEYVDKSGCQFTTAGCNYLWDNGFYDCSRCDDFSYNGGEYCKNTNGDKITCYQYNTRTPDTPSLNSFSGSITLHWSAEDRATSYEIYRSTDGSAFSQVGTQYAPQTGWYENASNISYTSTLSYKITASNSSGTSGFSQPLTFYHPNTTVSPSIVSFNGSTVIETKNDIVEVANLGSGSLTWTATYNRDWIADVTSPGVDGDEIDISIDRGELSDTELATTVNYSGQITVASPQGGNETVTVNMELCVPPGAPGNLEVSNQGSWGQAPILNWTSTPITDTYKIFRKVGSGSYAQIASTTNTSYTDNDFSLAKNATVIYYYVKAWNAAGFSAASNMASTQAEMGMEANQVLPDLSLEPNESVPAQYELLPCYPNPANPGTIIQFQLPEAGNVELKIISVTGRAVKTLVSGQRMAGTYEVHWDGQDEHGHTASTGMYFYVLHAGGKVFSRKFSLLK